MISAAYCNKELCRMLDKAGIEAHHVMAFEKGGSWYKKYTLDIANRWLREVHHLHIVINYSSYLYGDNPYYWSVDREIDVKREITNIAISTATKDYTYKTYEEAHKAAIRYCVENLI